MSRLMALEDAIQATIRNAIHSDDREYSEELGSRLANVQRRVTKAMID